MLQSLRAVARACAAAWLGAVMALSGCASPKPPPHHWRVQASFEHIPLTGLPAAPTVLAGEQPIRLVNFGQQEQAELRERAVGSGAGSGAGQGAVMLLAPPTLIMCAFLPPLCVGVVAVAATAGGAVASAQLGEPVSSQHSEQFASHFKKYPASTWLQQELSESIPAPGSKEDNPRLIVTIESVGLLTNKYGVMFVVRADVQGYPAPGVEWKRSVHIVPLPSRPAGEWLADDGKLIGSDYKRAIVVLSAQIRSVYLSADTPTSR
jgi:hypothetical protein